LDISLVSAFIVGLFSTLHCLGMCGGIIGALTFSLPADIRNDRWRLFPYISAYNLGRISSYTLVGAIVGGLGDNLFNFISPEYGHLFLQGIAAMIMVGIGLYLAGWFPRFAEIEKLGQPLWRKLEPLGQKLLPVRSPSHAFLFGLIWGWLPCGLVYSALLWSASTGSATNGALFMLAFGAGTLPTVMTAGIVTGWLMRLTRVPHLKVVVGLSLIVLALASLFINLQHSGNMEHGEHRSHQHETMVKP
jgi:sulfite exporter TauE/SafE